MFVLREEHVAAFREASMEQFLDDAVTHFRNCFADQTRDFDEEALRRRAAECVDRAARYGIHDGSEVLYFADVTFLWAEDFDTSGEYPVAEHLRPGGMERLLQIAIESTSTVEEVELDPEDLEP